MANNPPRKWVVVIMLILLVVLWIALVSIITSGWPPDSAISTGSLISIKIDQV